MAKFYGKIGFEDSVETAPGVWSPEFVEKNYYGDVLRQSWRNENSQKINDDITINNQLSVIADSYINQNIGHMRYVEWMGTKWKISSVDIQYPRIILELGGVYNAE